MNEFRPARPEDVAWLHPLLRPSSQTVVSLVPHGFESYARILNPIERDDSANGSTTWASVARVLGTTIEPETAWLEVEETAGYTKDLGEPPSGTVSSPLASQLVERLWPFAGEDSEAFALMWHGHADIPKRVAPTVSVGPEAEMYVYTGGLSEVAAEHWGRIPMHWWPANRSWYVGGDVYGRSIYIGGSREAVEPLLDEFEGFIVLPETRVPFEP